jgi:hypothetical protein
MAIPITMTDSRAQFLLAQTPTFQSRVAASMCQVALEVLAETGVGADHAQRAAYAQQVLSNPTAHAQSASVIVAQSTNVRGTITMADEGPITSVTDAALASQIATLWNVLAGIDTGN